MNSATETSNESLQVVIQVLRLDKEYSENRKNSAHHPIQTNEAVKSKAFPYCGELCEPIPLQVKCDFANIIQVLLLRETIP